MGLNFAKMIWVLWLSLASTLVGSASLVLEIPKAREKANQQDGCVEPVAEMRRNHMKKILHQRDRTMREGVRTSKYSLKACINCHVATDSNGVIPKADSPKHFCNSCHAFTGVTIDCFDCHSSAPEPAAKLGGGPQ